MQVHPALDPNTHLVPALKSAWPAIYGHFSKHGLLNASSWITFYKTADVMHSAIVIDILFTIYVYVMQEITGNASQVDGLWTFLPGESSELIRHASASADAVNSIIRRPCSHLLRSFHAAEVHRRRRTQRRDCWLLRQNPDYFDLEHDRASVSLDPRSGGSVERSIDLQRDPAWDVQEVRTLPDYERFVGMAVSRCSLLHRGEEDYRWPLLRAKMSRWQWELFTISFIATAQLILLACTAVSICESIPECSAVC